MRKFVQILVFILVGIKFNTSAQVKIGGAGAPVSSAIFELSNTVTNRGLLFNEVDLEVLTGGNPAIYGLNGLGAGLNGMVVYNKTLSANYLRGLHVWYNNKWNRLVDNNILTVPISSLTAATKSNTINNVDYKQTWNWNAADDDILLSINAPALTSGTGLEINGGPGLTTSGLTTGKLFSLSHNSPAGIGQLISTPALTTGTALKIDAGNSLSSGNALSVVSNSTFDFNNGAVRFEYNADHGGYAFLIQDGTSRGSIQRIEASGLQTGNALIINTNSPILNTPTGVFNVTNIGPSTLGVLARFQSNQSAASGMTILTNGNVGIGTATPQALFQVNNLPVHADNAAAVAAMMPVGGFYRTPAGVVMVRF